jgi:pimeloyl-ACP methyl ester carboxylesterase
MTALTHDRACRFLDAGREQLSVAERVELDQHLAECAECRAYTAELTVLQSTLGRVLHERWDGLRPDPQLENRFQARIRRQTMSRRILNNALGVAALLAVVVIFVALFSARAQSTAANSPTAVTPNTLTPTTLPTLTSMPTSPSALPTLADASTPQASGSNVLPDWLDERVDIGVATLHLHCYGKGSPTVVLNGGPSEAWITWQSVISAVGKFTRVCAYDRAGLGSSSPGPEPRTSQQMANELAALLDKAKIPGPYVLVSHSTSNWIDRLYTAQHRDQVAALVFVAPFHEDMISGTLAILAPYPADLESTRQEMANKGEGLSVDDWLTSADQVRAAGTLGDLPLVLVAPGKVASGSEPYAGQMAAMLAQQEQQLLALSTNSVRLVADNSGHFIQRDQPQMVVQAIQLAIEKIKP